jgi:hypothetical protein
VSDVESMTDEYEDVFTCVKCRNPRVTKFAKVIKDNASVTGKCLKGHAFNLKLPMEHEHKWIGYLRDSIYKCKCGMPLEDHRIKVGKKKTHLILKCTKHKQSKTIDTILWNTISTDRETKRKLEEGYYPEPAAITPEPEEPKNNAIKIERKEPAKPEKWESR